MGGDGGSFSDGFPSSLLSGGLISNILQVLGLDGGKVGALAVNGIIFIAQMVRTGWIVAGKYFDQSLTDWRLIINYLGSRIQEANSNNQQPASLGGNSWFGDGGSSDSITISARS